MSISELQKQQIDLQKKCKQASNELLEVDGNVHKKINELKSENLKLKKIIIEKEENFDKKIDYLENTNQKLRDQIKILEKKEKHLDELKNELSVSESAFLKQRVLDMGKKLQNDETKISSLEKKLQQNKQLMESEIQVREVKIKEYEYLIKKQGIEIPKTTNIVSDKESAVKAICSIFTRTKSNVLAFLPDINVVDNLDIEGLRSVIRVQLAIPVKKNMEIVDKLKMKSNVEIREYTDISLWGIIRDNEELLLAPLGVNKEPSGLIMKGDLQIEMFGNIIRSIWTKLKHI
ncbi:MAG: hypothetical protein ACFFD2_01140 [Promethearchaeota archaeon]